MRVGGKTTKPMVRVDLSMQTVMSMMDNGKMTRLTATESIAI